jgi:hypothetical protein
VSYSVLQNMPDMILHDCGDAFTDWNGSSAFSFRVAIYSIEMVIWHIKPLIGVLDVSVKRAMSICKSCSCL